MSTNIYFTDVFEIEPTVLKGYGALNISLINDLPLFVDPFLFFYSDEAEHRALHDNILRYLSFLRDRAAEGPISDGLLRAWYMFPEVKQNWLGYSKTGNNGAGLGIDFARKLHRNLTAVFADFGAEKIAQTSHLEKLCLIEEGVGCDSISDFVTNLIKEYLLDYTQSFAKNHLKPSQCRTVNVRHVRFDYNSRTWATGRYFLPCHNKDYVILTPSSILTRDDTWINRSDLLDTFEEIIGTVPNEQMRAEFNQYFASQLPKVPAKGDPERARAATIRQYPQILDYFISRKEETGEQAQRASESQVDQTEHFFVEQVSRLAIDLCAVTSFYQTFPRTAEEVRTRVLVLKNYVENKGGYRFLFVSGKPIHREQDLHLLYRLIWFAMPSVMMKSPGSADDRVSEETLRDIAGKNPVTFKLASSPAIKRALEKQAALIKAGKDTSRTIMAIVSFSDAEHAKVSAALEELKIQNCPEIVLISVSHATTVSLVERGTVGRNMLLEGGTFEHFRDALVAAFPTWDRLSQMVRFGLNENLEAIVPKSEIKTAAFKLITWAEAHGNLWALLNSARESNAGNPNLAAFAQKMDDAR